MQSRDTGESTNAHDEVRNRVEVDGNVMVIADLVVEDVDVVAYARDAGDATEAVRAMLSVGARALRAAQTSVDVQVIELAFAELNSQFESQLSTATETLETTTEKWFDGDNGELTELLGEWRQEVEGVLNEVFDADSKTSALSKLDGLMETHAEKFSAVVGQFFDFKNEDSAISYLKNELTSKIEASDRRISDELRQISETLAREDAQKQALERSAVKGQEYEDFVFEALSRLGSRHADVVEQTGRVSGLLGSNVGDIVVTVSSEDGGGAEMKFAVEVKDKKMSMSSVLDELEDANKNRGASASLMVFSGQEKAPVAEPFQPLGRNKAVVVLEKEGGDDQALRLGYMWARWLVTRGPQSESELDVLEFSERLGDLRGKLKKASSIRRAHTSAKKKIDEASSQLDEMEQSLAAGLDELEDRIS